ncbi:MAG: glycosyl hydrolase family 28-related protein [Candidatus Nitrosocaldaceae archaeon]
MHRLEFYAIDRLNNRSSINSILFTIPKIFNVKDYGAKGDGIADDTQAIRNTINAAINYLNSSSLQRIAIVYFPAGNYLVQGSTLQYNDILAAATTTNNSTTLMFLGTIVSQQQQTATKLIRPNGAGTLFRFINCHNLQFRNINFYFMGPSKTTALQFRESTSNITIESCVFNRNTANDDSYYADPNIAPYDYIAFMASDTTSKIIKNIVIRNNEFYDAPEDCIAFKVGGWQPATLDGYLEISRNRFVRVSSSHRLTLNNEPRPGAAITYANPTTSNAQIIIDSNYFESTSQYRHSIAIGYSRFRNAQITNNVVKGFTQGIRAYTGAGSANASYNVRIANNTLDGRDVNGTPNIYPFGSSVDPWRNSGIVIHGDTILVENNSIQYFGLFGFYLYYIDKPANIPSTNVTLQGNTIINNNQARYSWVSDVGKQT